MILLCILVLMLSVLCACGKKKEPETQAQTTAAVPQTETQTEKPTEAETKKPMDSGELVNIVFKDLKLSIAYAADIEVHPGDAEGNVAISFKLNNINCSYVLNGTTGAIVSKNVPPEAVEVPANSPDPFEKAINTAMDSIEGYSGGAENIQASMSEGIIEVNFDWNGQHYTFHYDMNQEKLVD
jgi:hypothetical protein